jgi:hypothetical protein
MTRQEITSIVEKLLNVNTALEVKETQVAQIFLSLDDAYSIGLSETGLSSKQIIECHIDVISAILNGRSN